MLDQYKMVGVTATSIYATISTAGDLLTGMRDVHAISCSIQRMISDFPEPVSVISLRLKRRTLEKQGPDNRPSAFLKIRKFLSADIHG